jgi:metal-responsive CopG/Arc/MetJ family transcriptional regulator
LQLLALVALMPIDMTKQVAKISVSLPPDLHQWLDKYSTASGYRIPKSQIIAKALHQLRGKSTAKK